MNDPSKPTTFAQCRQIMKHSEDVPTGRLFAKHPNAMNNQEEKQLSTTVNPAQLMQISTDVAAAVCRDMTYAFTDR